MRRSGTNPTAAAIGLLQLLDENGIGITEDIRTGVVNFLAEMSGEDGGLRANGRVPLSDLLSTFTGRLDAADASAHWIRFTEKTCDVSPRNS